MKEVSIVKYETERGEVVLSPEIVKKYLVSGDPNKVTDQEVMLFINISRYMKLNPFLREVYLVPYGDKYPASIIVSKDVFVKRAAAHPQCAGWEAGVIVRKKDGSLEEREGSLVLDDEELVGGWAKVYRKDWEVPLKNTVSFKEYVRYRKDGSLQSMWSEKPATMIKKVAEAQALREAFPEGLQGLYIAEEFGMDDSRSQNITIEVEKQEENTMEEEQPATNDKDNGKSNGKNGKDMWSWFWGEVRKLGFSPKEAHAVEGVDTFSGYTREQLEQVLEKLAAKTAENAKGKLL